mmetsp:Transcript_1482/g.4524  ORF Transcript_1482/g.4524 Transcript_1482/m.4524 type:complete len:302 (-) Transcript_1482:435-1340(-)
MCTLPSSLTTKVSTMLRCTSEASRSFPSSPNMTASPLLMSRRLNVAFRCFIVRLESWVPTTCSDGTAALFCKSKARRLRSSEMGSWPLTARSTSAPEFRDLTTTPTLMSSSSVTRSALLMMTRSAYAICSTTSSWPPSNCVTSPFLALPAACPPRARVTCFHRCTASTTANTASSFAVFTTSLSAKKDWMMGAGLAMPVVSRIIASKGAPSRAICSFSTRVKSALTEQHTQPFLSSTISSFESLTRSSWSTPTAPTSFSTTKILASVCCRRTCWIIVVLPAPRNPVTTVTGILPRFFLSTW